MIAYQIEENITLEEFRTILISSNLGERRPIHSEEILEKMIEHGNLIVTARDNGKLVGVSRSLTDFSYCTYLSDLAVDKAYQKMGIGKELIKRTKQATPDALLILLAAPAAVSYYPTIGLSKYDQCYILRDIMDLN